MSTQKNNRQRFNRRFRFSMSVLAAQLLLGAVAITWCVHMVLILIHGEVCFQEPNSAILYTEIAATVIVIIYSATVFGLQWKRMGERRGGDRRSSDRRDQAS